MFFSEVGFFSAFVFFFNNSIVSAKIPPKYATLHSKL